MLEAARVAAALAIRHRYPPLYVDELAAVKDFDKDPDQGIRCR